MPFKSESHVPLKVTISEWRSSYLWLAIVGHCPRHSSVCPLLPDLMHAVPVCFSCRVLNCSFFESREIIGPFMSHTVFNGLLFTLQFLHFIWTYLIVRLLKNSIMSGQQVNSRHLTALVLPVCALPLGCPFSMLISTFHTRSI